MDGGPVVSFAVKRLAVGADEASLRAIHACSVLASFFAEPVIGYVKYFVHALALI